MSTEKAIGIVLRTTDWSETSRIATLWTREFGKVRALAKGGRRLQSRFESALDLLTVCNIVFIRKSSGALDLLTEARVERRFPGLRANLAGLYAAYYVAELLSDWTEDHDPHPALFDEAIASLSDFSDAGSRLGPRLIQFELAFLRELGYSPSLRTCAGCGEAVDGSQNGGKFSPSSGGMLCTSCVGSRRDAMPMSASAWLGWTRMEELGNDGGEWTRATREEMRQLLNGYMTYLHGRPARLQSYLGS